MNRSELKNVVFCYSQPPLEMKVEVHFCVRNNGAEQRNDTIQSKNGSSFPQGFFRTISMSGNFSSVRASESETCYRLFPPFDTFLVAGVLSGSASMSIQ